MAPPSVNNNANNLEHCLRQKLTSMENSIARIYSIKSFLRNSAEQTRKDISSAIDHQLQCVRAREQELLFNLEHIMAKKEQKLCEQQEQLNQAIGACQQSLECVLRNNAIDTVNVQNMLLRMNAIDLRPKETPNILFEFDPSDLRRDISIFGRIIAEDRPKTLESALPLDVEHYEDDALLSHKSVLRLHPTSNTNFLSPDRAPTPKEQPQQLTPFSESINFWLSQMKPPATTMDCEEEFEFIRDRITSMSQSGSSFEVVNNNNSTPSSENIPLKTKPEEIFNIHFSEINRRPNDFWLKRKLYDESKKQSKMVSKFQQNEIRNRCAANAKSPLVLPDLSKLMRDVKLESNSPEEEPKTNSNKRKRTLEEQQASGFDFEKVIKSIQQSSDEHWLLCRCNSLSTSDSTPPGILQSSYSAEDVIVDPRGALFDKQKTAKSEEDFHCCNKKKRFWHPVSETTNLNIESELAKPIERRPANENVEELDTWESVLGWKRILEKIHASGEDEWLHPSSRVFAAAANSNTTNA